MKRLFGTDGIRAVAGKDPLTPPSVRKFGAALAEVMGRVGGRAPRVALGRDTRESGPWLRDAVASGLASRGASAVEVGVITTPGLAYLTRTVPFDASVMISASHNPFHDNGLKVFTREGTKLSDPLEEETERLMLDSGMRDPGSRDGALREDGSLARRYVKFLEGAVPAGRFRGLRLALDCAHGSASAIAPEVFRYHGAEVETIGASPDGRNINAGCGSLHTEGLARAVREGGGDLGIAFDGDADRALAVDRRGRLADGDCLLYVTARGMKRSGKLRGDAVVATIMSNLWLERHLALEGIRLLRAPVGDKYVLERLVEEDLLLGGEQSGHVIFRDRATTGDGILTGLILVDTLLDEGNTLETVLDGIVPCPQILLNVPVRERPELRTHPVIGPAVVEAEAALAGEGRVVLRYSGTEAIARVMVEGTDPEAVRRHAEHLASVIREQIGA